MAAFQYFQEKEGMQAILESTLKNIEPSRLPKPNSKVAFAFDIDGLLVHGGTPLPGAKATLEFLQRKKVPFIFLTNVGGATEKDHVAIHGAPLYENPVRAPIRAVPLPLEGPRPFLERQEHSCLRQSWE